MGLWICGFSAGMISSDRRLSLLRYEVPVDFMYKGKNCNVSLTFSYGSKAVFVEGGTHLLIKSF